MKPKVVFLHLMGTHGAYKKRYPDGFDLFQTSPKSKFNLNESAKNRINEYDTAVKYNDSIVFEIIKKVKSKQSSGAVLYFSDHGEDVYSTTSDFLGHNGYYSTTPMFEIPFIFWQSEAYKELNPSIQAISNIEARSYILEDFIHTFIDVLGVSSNIYIEERSILNPKFKPKKRIVKSDTNYDETH